MKKILMTLAAAFVAVSMSAQVYVGGGLGFESVSHDGDSQSSFTIMPEIGYTLEENTAVGIVLGYTSYTNDDSRLYVAPYYRYGIAQFGKVNLFVDGTIYFNQFTEKNGNIVENKDLKTNSFGIGVKPGVSMDLNDKLTVATHLGFLGYDNEKTDATGAKAYNTFGFNFSSLNLGFSLYYNF